LLSIAYNIIISIPSIRRFANGAFAIIAIIMDKMAASQLAYSLILHCL